MEADEGGNDGELALVIIEDRCQLISLVARVNIAFM